jgi:hypothetical protein
MRKCVEGAQAGPGGKGACGFRAVRSNRALDAKGPDQIRKQVVYSIFYDPKASPASWKGTYVGADLSLVSIQLIGFCIGDSAFCPSAVRLRLPSSPLRPVTL